MTDVIDDSTQNSNYSTVNDDHDQQSGLLSLSLLENDTNATSPNIFSPNSNKENIEPGTDVNLLHTYKFNTNDAYNNSNNNSTALILSPTHAKPHNNRFNDSPHNTSAINNSTFDLQAYIGNENDDADNMDTNDAIKRLVKILRTTIQTQAHTITQQSLQLHDYEYKQHKLQQQLNELNERLESQYAREFDHVEQNAELRHKLKAFETLDRRASIHDIVDHCNDRDTIDCDNDELVECENDTNNMDNSEHMLLSVDELTRFTAVDDQTQSTTLSRNTNKVNNVHVQLNKQNDVDTAHNHTAQTDAYNSICITLSELQQYCESLESALLTSTTTIEQMLDEKAYMQQQLNGAQQMHTSATLELSTQLTNKQVTIDKVTNDLSVLRTQHTNTIQQYSELQEEHTALESILNSKQDALQQANEQIEVLQNDCNKHIETAADLQQQLNDANDVIQEQQNRLSELQVQYDKSTSMQHTHTDTITELNSTITTLQQQLSDIHNNNTQHIDTATIVQQASDLEWMLQQQTDTQIQLKQANEQVTTLQAKLQQLQGTVESHQQTERVLQDTIDSYQRDNTNTELQQTIQQLNSQFQTLMNDKCTIEQQLIETQHQCNTFKTQLDATTQTNHDIAQQLETQTDANTVLKTRNDEVMQQLSDAQHQHAAALTELNTLKDQVHNTVTAHTTLQQQYIELQTQHTQLQQTLTTLQARIELSDTQLAQATNDNQQLTTQLHAVEQLKQQLQSDSTTLQQQLQQQHIAMNTDNNQLQIQYTELLLQHTTLQSTVSLLESELTVYRNKYNTTIQQMTQLTTELQIKQQQLDTVIQNNTELSTLLTELQQRVTSEVPQLVQHSTAMNEQHHEQILLQQNTVIDTLKSQLELQTTDNTKLIQQITVLTTQLTQLQADNVQLQASYDKLKVQSSELVTSQSVEQLIHKAIKQRDIEHKQHIDTITQAHTALQQKLVTIQTKHTDIVNTMKIEYDKQLHTLQQKYAQKSQDVKRLSDVHSNSFDKHSIHIVNNHHNIQHWQKLTQIQQTSINELTDDNNKLKQQLLQLQQQLHTVTETSNISNHTIERLLVSNRQLQTYLSKPTLSTEKKSQYSSISNKSKKKLATPIALSFQTPYTQVKVS